MPAMPHGGIYMRRPMSIKPGSTARFIRVPNANFAMELPAVCQMDCCCHSLAGIITLKPRLVLACADEHLPLQDEGEGITG